NNLRFSVPLSVTSEIGLMAYPGMITVASEIHVRRTSLSQGIRISEFIRVEVNSLRVLRGLLLLEQGNLNEAKLQFSLALELCPESFATRHLAEYYLKRIQTSK